MKRVCAGLAKYTIGILAVSFVIAFFAHVQGQEPASPVTASPQPARPAAETVGAKADDTIAAPVKPKPDPFDTYVFPTHRERFDRYVKDTVGPFRLARTAAAAGLDQWHDSPEEWGQGMKGYGKRFASSFGRSAIQQTVTYGLDEALSVDSGFHRSGREGFGPRLKHAFLETITSRTKSGNRILSAPKLAGVYTGAIVATETWYPERYSYKDGLRMGTGTLLTNFGINIVREFFINW
ncbi:MAG TPA: hypothetical protein VHQ94_16110 [Pyrinomonadaceae bacterium]|jgi:hypothetical protein|nr:hypothetical protein [Pyrinomonadaceae bacterium]